MSFGFSVTDFIALGGLALKLYEEFREAPGACRAFANELLLFHLVLDKLGSDLQDHTELIGATDHAALKACADSCKELIYVQIYGAACVPTAFQTYRTTSRTSSKSDNVILQPGPYGDDRFLRAWRQRWGERKFAARIPEIQRAVTAHIQSLTAFNTLIIRSDQLRIFACQDRSEALHEQTQAYIEHSHLSIERSQNRLVAASDRLERSHAKMERQLQSILASQQRQENQILSQSLDASSPEGREAWMNLGRLLRTEGITPAMIKQNRAALVQAMKTTLQGDEQSNTPQSYHTACESLSKHHRTFTDPSSSRSSAQASLSLLGSAPPRGPTFTNEFLERHKGAAPSLEQDKNVHDGLQFLLQGMDSYQLGDKPEDVNDEIDLEGLGEAHETTENNRDNMVSHFLMQESGQEKLDREGVKRQIMERNRSEWEIHNMHETLERSQV